MLKIREAVPKDEDAIWAIIEPVIREGETYDFSPDTGREEALQYWFAPGNTCYVAEDASGIVGTYVLHANRKGRGSHVANCGYMTAPHAYGRGVGSAMCEHSLSVAKEAGFLAMQFNFVVASNHRAIALWTRMGFAIVGRIPKAYLHATNGYTDALVMHRFL